ncbi:hypothetical protein NC652_027032 [Populus alba x Populus x berolinensis]|nr:hypothetical protein NC652_027032 [Populus alba x Populus x berolinensis]
MQRKTCSPPDEKNLSAITHGWIPLYIA